MSWTDERIDLLRRMWGQGRSASDIAELLGDVTRNAVIGKAHRLGLSGRPSPIRKRPDSNREGATILSLTERMCKWPLGDPKHPDFHFCGQQAHVGLPYCAEHASLAYQPAKRREDERRFNVA